MPVSALAHWIPTKIVVGAIVTKAAIMAVTLRLVLPMADLSDFEKGLIIASISAIITGVFTVCAAIAAVRLSRPVHQDVQDIKRKIGAARRAEDPQPGEYHPDEGSE